LAKYAAGGMPRSPIARWSFILATGQQGEPFNPMRMEVEKTGQASPESRTATVRGIPSMGLIPISAYLLLVPPTGAIERVAPVPSVRRGDHAGDPITPAATLF
jgi:hypothetical protein